MVTRVGDVVLRGAANGSGRPGSSSQGTQLQQADVANLLRGPVGSVLTMHVRRSVGAGAHANASPSVSGSRVARPSSGGYSPMPALAGARGPEVHEAGVGDKEDEELAGLEIQVCLTRVGLNSLPVTPAGTSAASGIVPCNARCVHVYVLAGVALPASETVRRALWWARRHHPLTAVERSRREKGGGIRPQWRISRRYSTETAELERGLQVTLDSGGIK
jgi:hypothetical protein